VFSYAQLGVAVVGNVKLEKGAELGEYYGVYDYEHGCLCSLEMILKFA
jgi:hypothetical protein